MATRTFSINAAANISKVPRSWTWSVFAAANQVRTLTDELHDDHATFKTLVDDLKVLLNALRVQELTRCVTPPTFVIDTNFDIKNSVAFEIIVAGILKTVAANVNFDTGTSTIVTTNAYWAAGLLSINVDGTTAYVDWGAEAVDEATAKANLSAVTASGGVVCGYVAVQAKAGQDLVGGTDALTGGTGGQVAQNTNYYNDQYVGDAAMGAAVSSSSPATLTAAKVDDFVTRELGTPS